MGAAIQLAARVGRRDDVRVTVVNPRERFTERLRLHMTATRQPLGELRIPDLLAGTGARFVRGRVTAVDADARTVRIDDDRVLRYDTAVYGMGGMTDSATVPGVAARVAAWFAGIGTVTYEGVAPGEMSAELVEINGGPGVVFGGRGQVVATLTFDFDADGRITAIHNVANPDKLRAVAGGTAHDIAIR
jgi:hypothetical protein